VSDADTELMEAGRHVLLEMREDYLAAVAAVVDRVRSEMGMTIRTDRPSVMTRPTTAWSGWRLRPRST
jgi:hypothetical protein